MDGMRTTFVLLRDQCPRRRSQSDATSKNSGCAFAWQARDKLLSQHGEGNDAAPWHLLTGVEHADAASLMAAADVTGHQNDQGASYRRCGVLQWRRRPKINFCEIFDVVRFST